MEQKRLICDICRAKSFGDKITRFDVDGFDVDLCQSCQAGLFGHMVRVLWGYSFLIAMEIERRIDLRHEREQKREEKCFDPAPESTDFARGRNTLAGGRRPQTA